MTSKEANGSSNGREEVFSRLPKNVVPSHYDLSLEPDLVKFTFTGTEQVTVEVKEPTDRIILNGAELEVNSASFEAAESKLTTSEIIIDEKEERITLVFPEQLKPGRATLHMSFKGILNDRMKGFYRAKYPATDGSSTDRYMATTQFESVDARRAFPCWDEPAIKATFKVTLIAPKDLIALSNMPVVSEKSREDGHKIVEFDVTPLMSTYLLAFVVGEFDYIETKSKNGVLVRVYTPVGKKEHGRFSLELGARALDFYADYFNIPYPLPKMDFVSITDFCSGAMENWGLTTGREARILYDPANSSAELKQKIAQVVTHEMAHQWFGNLVTMEWWTHLWLNEGFAMFMENLCAHTLRPELRLMDQIVTSELLVALDLDALKSSHPVEVDVNNPCEIDEIFDDISYSKGCCVISMLHSYIGDVDFKKGLTLYLNRFKYKNAETADLWAALEEASSKPVGKVMSTWTRQKGFPVITVTESQDGDNRVLKLSQEKFSASGQLSAEEKEYLWMVPISVTTASSPDKVVAEFLLSSKSRDVVVPSVKPGEWIKLNSRFNGIYRVDYSESMLEALMPAIASKSLPPLDRLNILSDIFAHVTAGRTPTGRALKVIEAFKDEDDFLVWSMLASCLSSLSLLISNTDFDDAYREWGRKVLSSVKTKVSWEAKPDESHADTLMRETILSLLASFNDPSVLEESQRLFDKHANQALVIPANVRECVYYSVAKQADDKVYNTILRLYREADSSDEKNKLSTALGYVRDASLIQKTLTFSLSDELRPQDVYWPLSSLSSHKAGREAVWQHFKENFAIFAQRYRATAMFPRIIKKILPSFASEERASEVESFFEKNPLGIDLTIGQTVESIRLNAAWLARDREEIKKYLTSA